MVSVAKLLHLTQSSLYTVLSLFLIGNALSDRMNICSAPNSPNIKVVICGKYINMNKITKI